MGRGTPRAKSAVGAGGLWRRQVWQELCAGVGLKGEGRNPGLPVPKFSFKAGHPQGTAAGSFPDVTLPEMEAREPRTELSGKGAVELVKPVGP